MTGAQLHRLYVRDRDADDSPTFWGVCERGGRLYCCIVDGDDFESAESALLDMTLPVDAEPVAVARFTHPAYAYRAAARAYAVGLILDEASRVLGIPPAEE